MERKQVMLQVGDVIYSGSYGSISGRHVIARVTKTLAMTAKDYRFKREYAEGFGISPHPNTSWSSTSYHLATPELETRFQKAKMQSAVRSIKADKLSADVLKQIYDIITPTPKPEQVEGKEE